MGVIDMLVLLFMLKTRRITRNTAPVKSFLAPVQGVKGHPFTPCAGLAVQ